MVFQQKYFYRKKCKFFIFEIEEIKSTWYRFEAKNAKSQTCFQGKKMENKKKQKTKKTTHIQNTDNDIHV